MVPMKREDGSSSRTMRDLAMLSVLVAFEGAMAGFQQFIPPEWMWAYPVAHAVVLMRIAYLRVTTSQGLQR